MTDRIYYLYKITNTVNNKVYIGQTVDPKARWSRHKSNAKLNSKNADWHLCRAIRKYGIAHFTFEIIAQVGTLEEIDQIEINLIAKYNSADRNFGYNISKGGQGKRIVSEETRIKMSKRTISEDTKRKISAANKGRKCPEHVKVILSNIHKNKSKPKMKEETKKKLSEINTGRKASEETKRKMSDSMLGKNIGPENGMYGKRSNHAKLTSVQAQEIRTEYGLGLISMAKLANKYNISKRTVLNIIQNKIYR